MKKQTLAAILLLALCACGGGDWEDETTPAQVDCSMPGGCVKERA